MEAAHSTLAGPSFNAAAHRRARAGGKRHTPRDSRRVGRGDKRKRPRRKGPFLFSFFRIFLFKPGTWPGSYTKYYYNIRRVGQLVRPVPRAHRPLTTNIGKTILCRGVLVDSVALSRLWRRLPVATSDKHSSLPLRNINKRNSGKNHLLLNRAVELQRNCNDFFMNRLVGYLSIKLGIEKHS